MNANDAPEESRDDDEARARKAAADSLRRQIRLLKQGRKPRSLNEFVERAMAEDQAKQKE